MNIWSSYFTGSFQGNQYARQQHINLKPKNNQLIVDKNVFIELTAGCIIIKEDNLKVLHNECIFLDCSRQSSDGGGAVLIYGKSEIIQRRFLASNCQIIDGNSMFCRCDLLKSECHAYIIESSLFNSIRSSAIDTFTLVNCNPGMFSSNCSRNIIGQGSGAVFNSAQSELAVMNYSQIEGCRSSYRYITFCDLSGNYLFYQCNILNSTQGTATEGTIVAGAVKMTIESCYIFNCTKNAPLFYAKDSIIVKNSYVDVFTKNSNVQRINVRSEKATLLFEFYQNHLKIDSCVYPSCAQKHISSSKYILMIIVCILIAN